MRLPADTEPAKEALQGGVFPQRCSSLAIYQELKARVQRPDALRQAKCVLLLLLLLLLLLRGVHARVGCRRRTDSVCRAAPPKSGPARRWCPSSWPSRALA